MPSTGRPLSAGTGELTERVTRRAEQLRDEGHPKEPVDGGAEASESTLENPVQTCQSARYGFC
jgi:hypothetical protein